MQLLDSSINSNNVGCGSFGQVTSLRQLLEQKRTQMMNNIHRNCTTLENLDIDDQYRRSISEKLICVYHSSSVLQNYASDLEDLMPPVEQIEHFIQNYKQQVQDLKQNNRTIQQSNNSEDSESEDDMSINKDMRLSVQETTHKGLVEGVKRYQEKEMEVYDALKQLEQEVKKLIMHMESKHSIKNTTVDYCTDYLVKKANNTKAHDQHLYDQINDFLNPQNNNFEEKSSTLRPGRRGWALNPSGGVVKEQQHYYLNYQKDICYGQFTCACNKCSRNIN